MFKTIRKSIAIVILIAFVITTVKSPAYAQSLDSAQQGMVPRLPMPGVLVQLSPEFTPAHLQGITIHPDNALQFDFLINKGDEVLNADQKKIEYKNLVKYFLASLTIPDDDQWVNLSPYEKNRIIKDDFGKTEMGRDLLAEDYMLKQITSSMIYPENGLGKKFWDKIYQRAWGEYHTTQVPVNTFNKVWIVPDQAFVYESGNSAYILKSHLKVMLEEDYLSLKKHTGIDPQGQPGDMTSVVSPSRLPTNQGLQPEALQGTNRLPNDTHAIGSQVIREIILPELEKEVNEGKNFSALRQMYSGMILATWYKTELKESLLGKIYADKSKVKGVDQNPKNNEEIYKRYLRAFKKGVFNYIKEDVDRYTNESIPRKYFSGGCRGVGAAMFASPAMPASLLDDAKGQAIIFKNDTLNLAMSHGGSFSGNNRLEVANLKFSPAMNVPVSNGATSVTVLNTKPAVLIMEDEDAQDLQTYWSAGVENEPDMEGRLDVLVAQSTEQAHKILLERNIVFVVSDTENSRGMPWAEFVQKSIAAGLIKCPVLGTSKLPAREAWQSIMGNHPFFYMDKGYGIAQIIQTLRNVSDSIKRGISLHQKAEAMKRNKDLPSDLQVLYMDSRTDSGVTPLTDGQGDQRTIIFKNGSKLVGVKHHTGNTTMWTFINPAGVELIDSPYRSIEADMADTNPGEKIADIIMTQGRLKVEDVVAGEEVMKKSSSHAITARERSEQQFQEYKNELLELPQVAELLGRREGLRKEINSIAADQDIPFFQRINRINTEIQDALPGFKDDGIQSRYEALITERLKRIFLGKEFLIVDDDSLITTLLRMNILRFGGKVGAIAKDGLEAQEILKTKQMDAVISDVDMSPSNPLKNGQALAIFIKANLSSNISTIPIVFWSGNYDKHRETFARIGMHLIAKPVTTPAVFAALADLIEDRQAANQALAVSEVAIPEVPVTAAMTALAVSDDVVADHLRDFNKNAGRDFDAAKQGLIDFLRTPVLAGLDSVRVIVAVLNSITQPGALRKYDLTPVFQDLIEEVTHINGLASAKVLTVHVTQRKKVVFQSKLAALLERPVLVFLIGFVEGGQSHISVAGGESKGSSALTIKMPVNADIFSLMAEIEDKYLHIDHLRPEILLQKWKLIKDIRDSPWSTKEVVPIERNLAYISMKKVFNRVSQLETQASADGFSANDASGKPVSAIEVLENLFKELNKGTTFEEASRRGGRFYFIDFKGRLDLNVLATLNELVLIGHQFVPPKPVAKPVRQPSVIGKIMSKFTMRGMAITAGVAAFLAVAWYRYDVWKFNTMHIVQPNTIGLMSTHSKPQRLKVPDGGVLVIGYARGVNQMSESVIIPGNADQIIVMEKYYYRHSHNVTFQVIGDLNSQDLGTSVASALSDFNPNFRLIHIEAGEYNAVFTPYKNGIITHIYNGYFGNILDRSGHNAMNHQYTWNTADGFVQQYNLDNVAEKTAVNNKAMIKKQSKQYGVRQTIEREGGIDFNAANFDLQIKRDGRGMPLPLSQQNMAQLSRIQGFDAEIVDIKPAFNVPIVNELQQRLQGAAV